MLGLYFSRQFLTILDDRNPETDHARLKKREVGLKQLLFVLGIFVFGSQALAGFMVEPYLGYETGTFSTGSSGATNSDTTKGLVPGVRLGFSAPAIFWIALDESLESGGKISSTPNELDYDRNNLFLDVGADLVLIRLWGGYGFSNSLSTKSNGATSNFSGGTMLKAGIGFTFLPLVSLNFEYMTGSYGTYPTSLNSAKETMGVASVSIPMDF